MSGGSAKGGVKGKEPADEPVDEEEKSDIARFKSALMWGFMPLLTLAFPDRYKIDDDDRPYLPINQLQKDIAHVSGYHLQVAEIDLPSTYQKMKEKHDVFGREHNMPPSSITFHGSDFTSVFLILNEGFNPSLSKEGLFGNGPYVTPHAEDALEYARFDSKNILWIVFGKSHLGHYPIPLGSKGQRDFGKRADGTPNTTLCSPDMRYFCLSDPEAWISQGLMGFSIPEKPSDFALVHMRYRPDVWNDMKTRFEGLVQYKNNLLREERKKRKAEKWTAKVGSRKQPTRT